MSELRRWFEESLSIADEVARSAAICDLAFDAETLASEGRREDAIALAELLMTLDADDDLLRPAIDAAEQLLFSLGVRSLPTLDAIVEALRGKFAALSQREQHLAVAKALMRSRNGRDPGAADYAIGLLDAAAVIRPLSEPESRLRAEFARLHILASEA
jgi:hypothetical protein